MEVNVMTQEETERLAALEDVIRKDLKGFVRVGLALKEIRDGRLYRGKYTAWKDYLKSEWDISKAYSDYHIRAADIVGLLENAHHGGHFEGEDFSDTFKFSIPQNERQARPLSLLSVEQIPEAWKTVMQMTNGRPTALVVTKVVQEILEQQIEENKDGLQKTIIKEVTVPDDFAEQFAKLIEVLSMYRKSGWRDFNRKKALEFVDSVKEYLNS